MDYAILFDAVRWTRYPRWLPFGTVHMCFEKDTTWQDAHHMASQALESGGWNVRVVPACLDPEVCNWPNGRCVEPSRCKAPGQSGQTFVEYAVALAIISILVVCVLLLATNT